MTISLALVLIPFSAGALSLGLKRLRFQVAVQLAAAAGHLALCASLWLKRQSPVGEILAVDDLGLLALSATSALFLMASIYSIPYLLEGTHDAPSSPRQYSPLMLFYLGAMTAVCATRHLGLMWAAVEATTLASAPLVHFYRRKGSLEAAWKYLLLCSVGVALALLGTFFIALAGSDASGPPPMTLDALLERAPQMPPSLLALAFIFALIGYGTKMGLAPLHTWLPDAHSQAPSPVSALMSGATLNCALVAMLRFHQICVAAGQGSMSRFYLVTLGLISMGIASASMVGQPDYKRLLAFSSVENMGVIATGIGLGGLAVYAALLHVLVHSFAKAALFFVSGNLLSEYGTTRVSMVHGAIRRMPVSGPLLAALLFAIGGSPPFGLFMSEFSIFHAALSGGKAIVGVLFLAFLVVGFFGAAGAMLPMTQGEPEREGSAKESWLKFAPPLLLCLAVLLLGTFIPSALGQTLLRAAETLGGGIR